MKPFSRLIGLILIFAILIATTLYFVWPTLTRHNVDKAPRFNFPDKDEIGMIMPPQTIAEAVAARLVPGEQDAATTVAIDLVTAMTNEPLSVTVAIAVAPPTPAYLPTPLLTATPLPPTPAAAQLATLGVGEFVDGDAIYRGTGIATLYRATDGSYAVRFEEFRTTPGLGLHVILSPNAKPKGYGGLGDYVDLGALHSTNGEQSYWLPADIDPTGYKSVVIYCVPFRVIFATATLE